MQVFDLKGVRLSLQQHRLWQFLQADAIYRVQTAVWLDGKLDEAVFLQAWQQVIERHEILHTVFYIPAGMEVPVQVIGHNVRVFCPLINLENFSASLQLSLLDGNFSFLQTQPFDLADGPLLHAMLFRLSAERHQLLISASALCADAATLPLLLSELFETYKAILHGGMSSEDPLQYVTVSSWQNELLDAEEAKESLDFWAQFDPQQVMQTCLPFTSRTAQQNRWAELENRFVPRVYSVEIDEEQAANAHAFATHHGLPLATLFFSCWQIVLQRLIDDDADLVVGVACDGRDYEELTDALGLYTRFVPIGLSFGMQWTFEQVLAATKQSLQAATSMQSYFTWSSGDKEKYFPLAFEYQNWPAYIPSSEIVLSLHQHMCCTEPFILKLHVLQVAEQLQMTVQYDPRYIRDEHAARLSRTFLTLLANALERPQTPISALQVLSLDEQKQLCAQYRSPLKPLLAHGIHRLFEMQVEKASRRIALVSNTKQMTYQELNSQANQLARVLRRYGVGPNVLVGLCLPRSEEMIVALLAIFKAGGAYVPLDPESPPARLLYQMNNVQLPFLLTEQTLVAQLPQWDGVTLYMEAARNEARREDADNLSVSGDPGDSAYVIYTSGSTGLPKGVMVRQQSIVNYTGALCELLQVEPGWNFATVSTLAADLGNTAIFCSLASGGCLHILDYHTITSAEAFTRWSTRYPIDVLKIVPSHLAALLSDEHARGVLPRRALVLGGEPLPYNLVQRVRELDGTCKIYNHYGPTETTIGVLVNELQEPAGAETVHVMGSLPLGRPIANTDVYVLDSQLQIVPVGVVGELYIGGDGLANGYFHQPLQTAERFLPHPFSQQEGARLYRSGDLVRYTERGQIEFVGRHDSQIKLRGYRIELGEIEVALKQHANIWDCVVALWDDGEAPPQLVGYIVARKHPAPGSHELSEFLRERLPGYMIPTIFMPLKILPLSTNGKVDRRQLPRPELQQQDVKPELALPRNPIEEILLHIWKGLLAVPEIGIHDNFFQVGGHSLLATQVIAGVLSVMHIELSIQSLFNYPTIAELARCVEEAMHGSQEESAPPLVAMNRPENVPLSFAQQRLWFLDQLEPGSTTYLLPHALRIEGNVEVAVLERSLGEIVRRHESLRTTFMERAGQPVQVIHPARNFHLPVMDLRGCAQEEREHEVLKLAQQEAEQPCILKQGPLFRTYLLRLNDQEYVLFLTMHHIVSDGWSNGIFVRELSVLYSAFSAGQPSPLAPLPIQYADFALWQRQWLQEERLSAQLAYWQRQLSGVVPLELPTDHMRPALQTFKGADIVFALPQPLTDSLQALSRSAGVTLFMTLLATFQILLYRYSGQEDITIGTPITNRSRTEVEGLIGFFVNTLVLRSNLAHNPRFSELLTKARETCLDAYTHQDVPFEQIVDAVQPQRDLSRSPLFQVMFALQHIPDLASLAHLSDLQLSHFAIANRTSKFDLMLDLTVTGQIIQGRLEYATDLFDAQTMERLVAHWHMLLEYLVAHPDARIATLPLLTATEYQLLIEEWNSTQSAYPEPLVHQLIEAQVERTPDHIAAVFEGEQLSYRELNQRANQLAHYLQASGVGPEIRVGIYMEPSLDVLIAVLAVLKAGGAYVPIDQAYPYERVAFLLQDAHVTILLTQQHHLARLAMSESSIQIIATDKAIPLPYLPYSDNPGCNIYPDNLAYILYTSGSTGVPKGVMIPHRGLVNYLHWGSQYYAASEGWGTPVHSSLTFDLTVTALFSPLLVGRTVVLLPTEQGIESLCAALRVYKDLSLVKITPAHLALLSQQPDLSQYMGSTRLFVIGGEQLLAEQFAFWQELAPETRFVNEYGPTETVVGCCVYQVPNDQHISGPVPIGRPIANTQIYVLNQYLQPVPIGLPGELYIGGIGLAHGYLNQPELTAERFLPNPFDPRGGARLYRTGDLARYRSDGTLEFLGRNDHQVKVRGFRIELGEIEAVLSQHIEVRECVVMVREDIPQVKRLIAYVVSKQADVALLQNQLRDYVRQRLPDYMIPALFVPLERLSLSENGKVDRQALPRPTEIEHGEDTAFVAPRTHVEHILARIWAEVLGIDRVSITDNFFMLGGDSILSMQIIARAAQAHLRITLRQIFQQQTIKELAGVVSTSMLLLAEQGLVEGLLPLTPIQHWFFALPLEEPHHWNQSALLQLAGQIDSDILEKAIGTLLMHHDALRLRFRLYKGQWQQVNAGYDDESMYFSNIDLVGKSSTEQERIIRTMQAQAQASLDLAQGPLLRAVFFDRGLEQPGLLFICIHHLAVDNVSWQILLEDLQVTYRFLIQGKQPQLPAKTTSYQHWAEQLVRYAQSEEVRQEQAFWLEENRGEVTPLLIDFPESVIRNTMTSVRRYSLSLSQEETHELQEHSARTYHMQMNDIVLAMLALTLARWMETDSVLIDTERHGREEIADDIDVSRTVGWFTSIFPMYLPLQYSSSEVEALQSVQEKLGHLPYKGLGYGALRYLNSDPELRGRFSLLPQSEVLFNYVGQRSQVLSSATLFNNLIPSSAFDRSPSDTRPYLFEITAGISDGKLYIDWKYSERKHRQSTIEQLVANFAHALRALISSSLTIEVSASATSGFSSVHRVQDHIAPMLTKKVPPFVSVPRDQPIPLSLAQQRLWFLDQLLPDRHIYNITRLLRIRGPLNRFALRKSIEEIALRHEVLRTTFSSVDGEAVQIIHPRSNLAWSEIDLQQCAEETRETLALALAHAEAQKPIDLEHGPLMRILLFKINATEHILVMIVHHIVFDAWSLGIFIGELVTLYRALATGQPSPLVALPIQYADFAVWQRQWLQGDILNEQLAYWQRQLHNAKALALPTDHLRQAVQSSRGARKTFSLGKEHSTALANLSRQEGVTLFMTLLAGFMTLLLRYTGQTDIIVGTNIANRTQVETEQLIGFFVNLLVLRSDLSGNPAFTHVLRQISEMLQDAYAHQDLPFEKLIDALHLEREGGQTPLVKVLFVFQNIPWTAPDLEGITITPIQMKQDTTRFELAFFMQETAEGLKGTVDYSTDLFEDTTIANVITHFQVLLQNICAQPDARLEALKIYSEEAEITKRVAQISRLKKVKREEIISPE